MCRDLGSLLIIQGSGKREKHCERSKYHNNTVRPKTDRLIPSAFTLSVERQIVCSHSPHPQCLESRYTGYASCRIIHLDISKFNSTLQFESSGRFKIQSAVSIPLQNVFVFACRGLPDHCLRVRFIREFQRSPTTSSSTVATDGLSIASGTT